MSINWYGRLQRYVSAQPTEMPVREVSAVRPPQPRLAVVPGRSESAEGSGDHSVVSKKQNPILRSARVARLDHRW